MKKASSALIGMAVGMAFAGTASAGAVMVDINGAAGPNAVGTDRFLISSFDWAPGNMLIVDTTPEANAVNPIAIVAQAAISSMKLAGAVGNVPGISAQFTYQMRTYADMSAFTYIPAALPGTTFFDIFYDAGQSSSDVSGCNFGTNGCTAAYGGVRILTGTAVIKAGESTTLTQTGTGTSSLDQSSDGIDVDGGITTRTLSLGAFKVDVDVVSFNTAFFLSNIDSLSVDIQHQEAGAGAAFQGDPNPSDNVVGIAADAAFFGNGINDIGAGSCAGAGTVCGVQLANDASSTILNNVPEPGSLALLGLGIGAFGVGMRRRIRRLPV